MDFLGKGFTSAIIKILKELRETMSKGLKESMKIMSHQIQDINEETEVKKQEVLKLKSTITDI